MFTPFILTLYGLLIRYFSYEHFYVIYCKFWELDTDHDFLIDKENLIRYSNHALTYRIVDRIFSQVCYSASSPLPFFFLIFCASECHCQYAFSYRYQGSLLVKPKERCVMRISFISFWLKKTSHQNLV